MAWQPKGVVNFSIVNRFLDTIFFSEAIESNLTTRKAVSE